MGVTAFLPSVLSSRNSQVQSTMSMSLPDISMDSLADTLRDPLPPVKKVPRSPRHVSFTLPEKLYAWLETMAVVHNYGSVHKSVRDLLSWACTGEDDDLDWMFLTTHDLEPTHESDNESTNSWSDVSSDEADIEAAFIAEKQAHSKLGEHQDTVLLDARVSESHFTWLCRMVQRYSLQGPAHVLDAVCRCAIELAAADDVFESDECGHDLPESTAQLYQDLGLISFNPSAVSEHASLF